MVCDVTRPEDVDKLVATAVRELGQVDILVANAGQTVAAKAPVAQSSVEELQGIVGTNLLGALLCARAGIAQMLTQTGGGKVRRGSWAAGCWGRSGFVGDRKGWALTPGGGSCRGATCCPRMLAPCQPRTQQGGTGALPPLLSAACAGVPGGWGRQPGECDARQRGVRRHQGRAGAAQKVAGGGGQGHTRGGAPLQPR